MTLIAQEKSAEGIVPVITRLDNNFFFQKCMSKGRPERCPFTGLK